MQRHFTDDITRNLSFLAHNISNLKSILLELIQNGVISLDESHQIESKCTPLNQNSELLEIMQRKDWPTNKELFLEILRKTNNGHCANKIEDIPNESRGAQRKRLHNKLLKSTWWPDKKRLIESLHERKIGDKLLTDELHDRLEKDKNRMVVITESPVASKLTGMGGVGKTLTAIWYAHKYEHEYDHILWIDCGEESLLTSFKKLTRDMKIQDRNELIDVEEFSRKSYEELMQFKCLWIFDNAENYKGEGGMIKVLPKYMESFSCLITSRSKDWGVRNSGYGKISDLRLDIFNLQESVDFFKRNLEKEINYTEFQLKELCRLLGNLPLALQLAVAALNEKKIDLANYIEKTSAEDVENIVDVEFDAYERTINKSVKITLEYMAKETNGNVAKDILTILGYIRPDDVILDFLEGILYLSTEDVNKGIELLVKYSLISKELKTIDEETKLDVSHQLLQNASHQNNTKKESIDERKKMHVSIHRLLQQVIRYNGRENEKETLRKIIGFNGFVDYKLIPFTKYADEELRKEFPKVKAELLDQQQLKRLLKDMRFEESVQLARFIDQELQKDVTKFNYAMCLEKNGQLEDQIEVLEALYKQELGKEMGYYDDMSVEMALLKLDQAVSKGLVGGHLLVSHWKMKNDERSQEILEKRKSFEMIGSHEMRTILLTTVNSNLIQSNYCLKCRKSMFQIVLNGNTKEIELSNCLVDFSIALPNDLQGLKLSSLRFKDGNATDKSMIDFNKWLPKKLRTLDLSANEIILSLGSIVSIENIYMLGCSLNLDSGNRISPNQSQLWNVSFVKNEQELPNVKVNEFIDFQNMKRFQLIHLFTKTSLSIDLSEESADMEFIRLDGVNVLSLKSANSNKRVHIKEATLGKCSLDVSTLPPSLEKLSLLEYTELLVSREIDLPNLRYLKLDLGGDISPLFHFRTLQLSNLHLVGVTELNVDLLPPSIKNLRIMRSHNAGLRLLGGVIQLDRLILDCFILNEVLVVLSHFQPKQLIIYRSDLYKSNFELSKSALWIPTMYKRIQTIAFERFGEGIDDFQNFILPNLDLIFSEYIVFHEGTITRMFGKDFDEYINRHLSTL